MNLFKVAALAATIALAACGSREWRGAKQKVGLVEDVNTKAGKAFAASGFNPQDPASMELLKKIGGASLRATEASEEGALVMSVALNESCVQFQKEIPADTGEYGPVKADVFNSSQIKGDVEVKASFESHCIGKDGACDQIAVLFTLTQGDKTANAVLAFTKNHQGKFNVNPVQSNGNSVVEVDEYLSHRNGKCEEQPKDTKIYYED